ncbi:GbsR/MarR family transcriptional regulator [Limimaricola hongkongensis]|uniref:Putative transcription regulator, MarR family protein n=1 Tax=Limimaricola hongkongensis DSM 17492 TaxID=1122180 RepID=A0A017HB74_9RHOB|nr:MarR family transcriptional regulator [Limimaricola hongkongensis]EYD71408.1 putative transcription regulator, MarR family protein [Limimaricola hongkongensis DSM 17492]
MTGSTQDLTALRRDFVERLGVLAQAEGASRTAGRLFAILAFEGRALSFGELAEALCLGRSSISVAARDLEAKGMVRRVARKGDRQEYIELSPAVLPALRDWLSARRAAASREFEAVLSALPERAGARRARLGSLAAFHRDVATAIASAQAYGSDD